MLELDHQRTVDEIRSFVLSSDQTFSQRIQELAGDYAKACQEANQRLRRCADFVGQGLRSEAIQLAESEPNLLDMVAVLDFQELGQWKELAATYSFPAPPQLLLEAAEALNEAYAAVQPLENLLREHRLLALARAPLPARLGVLRKIAGLDPQNPAWAEDVRLFEKVRLQQIKAGVDESVARHDMGTVIELWQEVAKADWLESPPEKLVGHISSLVNEEKQKSNWITLQKLQVDLSQAAAAADVEKVRALAQQFRSLADASGLHPKDRLWERVAPALRWLEKQERKEAQDRNFHAALRHLEQLLPESKSHEELEQCYYAAAKFKRPIPEILQQHYRQRLLDLNRSSKKRDRMLLAGTLSAGAVVLVGFVGYMTFYRAGHARAVQQAVFTLEKMIEEDRIDDARKYLGDLANQDSRTATHNEVLELQRKVEERVAERERVEQFIRALRNADVAVKAKDPEATVQVAKAEGLARAPHEKNAVQELRNKMRDMAEETRVRLFLQAFKEAQEAAERDDAEAPVLIAKAGRLAESDQEKAAVRRLETRSTSKGDKAVPKERAPQPPTKPDGDTETLLPSKPLDAPGDKSTSKQRPREDTGTETGKDQEGTAAAGIKEPKNAPPKVERKTSKQTGKGNAKESPDADLEKAERSAHAHLQAAKGLMRDAAGERKMANYSEAQALLGTAEINLQWIVKHHPNSEAAKEAKELLKQFK